MRSAPKFFNLLLVSSMSLACGGGGGSATTETTGETSTGTGGDPSTEPPATSTTTGEPGTTTGETTDAPTGTSETGTPTTCGDGAIDEGELCDGAELGGKTCADVDDAFVGGALACAGDCAGFDVSGCELDPEAAHVKINEVLSKSAVSGEYADKGDAIEIYNAGGAEADLSGWRLSDDPTFPQGKTYVFPRGTKLAPGEWRVLVELDAMLGEGELPFGIASDGEETLTLVDAMDGVVDQVTLSGADAVVSYCRVPDGTGTWLLCDETLGAANAAASADCGDAMVEPGEDCDGVDLAGMTCEGLELGFTGGTLVCSPTCTFDASMCTTDHEVVINELESTNDDIEIYNAGDVPVDLSGWILTDDVVDQNYDPVIDSEKLTFAPQTSVAAKQFLVIKKGMMVGQHPFGLGADGDTVTLMGPDLDVVDQVSYGLGEAMVSYCRLPDGPGGMWTTGCIATLGMANQKP